MTHHPRRRLEQRFGRRIVQIDVVPIGHLEFQPAQRAILPGLLLDRPIAAKSHVMAGQITGICRQFRQYFLLRDGARDVPGRVEEDVVDRRTKFRGLLVDLTDDDAGRENRSIAAEQLEAGDRRIDDDPVLRRAARQPAKPFEVYRQLLRALVRDRRPVGECPRGLRAGVGRAGSDSAMLGIGAAHCLELGR